MEEIQTRSWIRQNQQLKLLRIHKKLQAHFKFKHLEIAVTKLRVKLNIVNNKQNFRVKDTCPWVNKSHNTDVPADNKSCEEQIEQIEQPTTERQDELQ